MTKREELKILLEKLGREAVRQIREDCVHPVCDEPDPRRKNLIILHKKKGMTSSWVYGPYIIDRGEVTSPSPEEPWGFATLLPTLQVKGWWSLSVLPYDIDSMPLDDLLNHIERLIKMVKEKTIEE